jgi:hypothetical protein
MSHDVFGSYARADGARVLPLYDRLQARGASVWMDAYRLDGVAEWLPEVEAAINAARAVLVAVTHGWTNSDPCRQELAIAREAHKPLLAILLEPAPPPADADVVDLDGVCERLGLR